jgi:CheY-like chemotaxis protein
LRPFQKNNSLPTEPSAEKVEVWGGGEAAMCSRARAFTVLIVEDYALIALEIEDAVRRNGGQVLGPVAQIPDGLALIETDGCDAALLDIRLAQGETVYAVAERLHAERVPFAFITAWDGEIDARFAHAPLLRKPFGEAELDRCLRQLISCMPHPAGEREAA